MGAILLDQVGTAAPGGVGALLVTWLIYHTWQRVLFVPDLVCPDASIEG